MKKFFAGCLLAVGLGALTSTPPAGADSILVCAPGSGVATTATSCPFAEVVRSAYQIQGGPDIVAYSPVTGRYYPMDCERG